MNHERRFISNRTADEFFYFLFNQINVIHKHIYFWFINHLSIILWYPKRHRTHVTYFSLAIRQTQLYLKEITSRSLSCMRGSRVKPDDEREKLRTGNEPTRGRRNIWRLASESTVSLGRQPIGDFSRISFLRTVESQISRPGHDAERPAGRQAQIYARPRFLVGRKESAHVIAPLSLISRRLLVLAYPITNVSGRSIISSSPLSSSIGRTSNRLVPDHRSSIFWNLAI